MRILLVDVPFAPQEVGGRKKRFATVLNIIPGLGLAYLGAVAEKEGHDVRILDCARGIGWEEIRRQGGDLQPDLVGITATTPTYRNALKAARILRETVPKATFVVGGPHPTAAIEHAASFSDFDYFVLGEGELTFMELLRFLQGKGPQDPKDIKGLAFRRGDQLVIAPPRERIENLDSIPHPARHLLSHLKEYHPTPASYRKLPLAHIMTSRGCPSRCAFCDRAVFGEKYRARSADDVLAEVEHVISKYGVKEVRFFDDTFTLNRQRLREICEGLRTFKPRLIWTCLTKVNCVTLDMLRMMREASCWQVLYGLESGDDRVLKTLGKNTTVEQNRKAVHWAREAGLRVRADFIVGTPAETVESLQKTLNLALELPLDFAHFNKFTPFPGTAFYRHLVAQGYEFDFSESMSTLDHDSLIYVPPDVPPNWYHEFLDRAYKRFYLRWRYVYRRLLAIRTLTELWGSAKGAFSIGSL